ncbi:hypothetical protein KC19_VG129200 [Ceratodon purpureus]|uniref:Uncharacterized protein n=1 Tax=Ceratodon purpureus TaxID=3225 RepID=A0A8T0HQL4_CERPU|nr:hypothetical protein KC19_VG129200 [Ceratodon purpureus]
MCCIGAVFFCCLCPLRQRLCGDFPINSIRTFPSTQSESPMTYLQPISHFKT